MTVIYADDWVTLHCARWQDVELPECDAVICDPPYSARTHAKQRHGRHMNQSGTGWISARRLGYDGIDSAGVAEIVNRIAPKCGGWFCAMTSHDLVTAYQAPLGELGRYVFGAPIPIVQIGMNVRLAGDGPSNWAVYMVVSRTTAQSKWGTLPGAYVGLPIDAGEQLADKAKRAVAGSKPLWLMRAIVRDYSRPGDLVLDPFCGGGTTALACRLEGRRCITVECDPATAEIARRRLSTMPVEQPSGQTALFAGVEP